MFKILLITVGLVLLPLGQSHALPFERTEQRAPCRDFQPLKRPHFGDLHIHSSYSFDSYISNQRNDPWAAYRYAKGEAIILPDEYGNQVVSAKIQRPLDFAGLTDHSEFLGQISVCTADSSALAYWWPHCIMTRANNFYVQLLAADWWTRLGVVGGTSDKDNGKSFACTLGDCTAGEKSFWSNIQRAAEDHYDRSEECSFTTFVGYEYTDAPDMRNMHRNVIFRNEKVLERPISTYDTGPDNFQMLWKRLRKECIEAGTGCDVLAIPHNSNLSGGMMFRDPQTMEDVENRLLIEPLVELIQHKASSECRFDKMRGIGLDTEDELCNFEQVVADNLSMLGSVFGKVRTERAAAVKMEDYAKRNMVRNALKAGLDYERRKGINPFKIGFIGSTDTHSATPGAAEEDNYVGHLGQRDSGHRNVQDHLYSNPGGHAVVWAEENSRDAIFEGMRRRETYATSGTRPELRFFGGWDFKDDMCDSADSVSTAYRDGVPMGSDLNAAGDDDKAPKFFVSGLKDPGIPGNPGSDLQRLQIIKGWIDAAGETHEKVYDIAGDPDNGASVNPDNCARTGSGFTRLCTVWKDPDYSSDENAFYYARLIENPSCRWSTLQCQAAGVNPFSNNCSEQAATATAAEQEKGAQGDVWEKCCIDPATEPFYEPVLQERAWSSPIWVSPGT